MIRLAVILSILLVSVGRVLADSADLCGRVCDVFRDDIDDHTTFMVLDCDSRTVYTIGKSTTMRELQPYIGCQVRIKSVVLPITEPSHRRHLKRLYSFNTTNDLTILSRPENGPFDVPSINELPSDLSAIDTCGPRAAKGRVIARWHGDAFLLRLKDGKSSIVRLRDPFLPKLHATVEVVGKVVSDLYRFNLIQAQWRPTCGSFPEEDAIQDTALIDLFKEGSRSIVNTATFGQTLRLHGTLKSLLADESGVNRLLVQEGAFQVVVDLSALPGVASEFREGSEIEATGVSIIESDSWHANIILPKTTGFFIVPRTPSDIRVLRQPPWWTPGRIWGIVGVLFAGLVGILIWNAALRRLASRKGRELMREQIGHVKSQLKTEERMRLAVELHDSLAQNLTGVALEIDTAGKLAGQDPSAMRAHLGSAARSLKSCRDELRNCLWDLRSRALEEPTMDAAIRQTLAPHVASIELAVRFNVPRDRISDNTVHTILRIVRELVLNGIRHGGATKIRVAGSVEDDKMRFSVTDNGRGFDPDNAPGFAEGHYGLLGIRERIDEFEGEFELKSEPGKGTRAIVTLAIPRRS